MSFLVEDHDNVATLEETLAFIDSLDLESAASSSDSDMSNSPSQDSHTAQDIETAKQKTKKRKRANLSSSTRLYQRKKAEVLYLRRRAQELEESIEQLKKKRGINLTTISPSMGNNWMKVAEAHFQARLRSEETNRSLKSIMASQIQVSDTLQGFIEKQVSFQAMDLESTASTMANTIPCNETGSQLFVKQETLNLNSKSLLVGLNVTDFTLGNNGSIDADINQAMITAPAAIPPTLDTYTVSL